MCNRYAKKGSIAEIRRLAALMDYDLATTSATDNYGGQDNIYPDQDAPILRPKGEAGLEIAMLRWGFPPIPGQKAPITNIRNLSSKWWRDVNREWMIESQYRCLVPFSAFAEPVRDSTWFSVIEREVSFYAGVWRPWHGERLTELPPARSAEAGKKATGSFMHSSPPKLTRLSVSS